MKKLALILLFVFFVGISNWQEDSVFSDLFDDIDLEDEMVEEEESKEDMHWSFDLSDIPNPHIYKIEKDWENYISVDWDIDEQKYYPVLMVNKDWSSYHSQSLWEDIHIEWPGSYLVRAQVRIDWEYILVDEKKIDNSWIVADDMWDPEAWPALYFLIITFILSFFLYFKFFSNYN